MTIRERSLYTGLLKTKNKEVLKWLANQKAKARAKKESSILNIILGGQGQGGRE